MTNIDSLVKTLKAELVSRNCIVVKLNNAILVSTDKKTLIEVFVGTKNYIVRCGTRSGLHGNLEYVEADTQEILVELVKKLTYVELTVPYPWSNYYVISEEETNKASEYGWEVGGPIQDGYEETFQAILEAKPEYYDKLDCYSNVVLGQDGMIYYTAGQRLYNLEIEEIQGLLED